jgi:hypothetical protein
MGIVPIGVVMMVVVWGKPRLGWMVSFHETCDEPKPYSEINYITKASMPVKRFVTAFSLLRPRNPVVQ